MGSGNPPVGATNGGGNGLRRNARWARCIRLALVCRLLPLVSLAVSLGVVWPDGVAMGSGPAQGVSSGIAAIPTQGYPRIANRGGFVRLSDPAVYAKYDLLMADKSVALGSPSPLERLKALNPKAIVLPYVNSKDIPKTSLIGSGFWGSDGNLIYPGWWATYAGSNLAQAIDSTQTTVPINDATKFLVGDDVLVEAESMQVTGIVGNRLIVTRGYYSQAAPHPAGARIAAHVSNWPGTWMANQSIYAPTNSGGQRYHDWLAERVHTEVLPKGPWDGIYYDSAADTVAWLRKGQVDADNDNVADGGIGWREGMTRLFTLSRQLEGPDAIIIGNNATYYDYANGRMFEGFPYFRNDYEWWGSEIDRYHYWMDRGLPPTVSTIKTEAPTPAYPDGNNYGSYSNMRYGLASTLLNNGYYIYTPADGEFGDYWFDEFSVDLQTGAPADPAIGKGYLGQPLGPAFRVRPDLGSPDQVDNGGFELDTSGWTFRVKPESGAAAGLDRDTTTAAEGSASARVTISSSSGKGADVTLSQRGFGVTEGVQYTVSFWAKASADRPLDLSIVSSGSPAIRLNRTPLERMVTSNWRRFWVSFTATASDDSARLQFNLGGKADSVWLDAVRFQEGSSDVFRRGFEHGIVLLNATASPQAIQLTRPFRKIKGTQDPTFNDGSIVTAVTLGSHDAIILLRGMPDPADADNDGFTDEVEIYLGTDPLDACPDNPSDDAWPLDIDNDRAITVTGDVLNFSSRIGAAPGAPNWWVRMDFNVDNIITVTGDVFLYGNKIGQTCT